MRTLPTPSLDPSAVFDLALSSVSDLSSVTRLTAAKPAIISAITSYETACSTRAWFTLPVQRDVGGALNKDCKALYKEGMSAAGGYARSIYTDLRKAAKNNTCPLCGVNTVSSLDHYLPQSRYASFVVLPINLVPACADCNKFKLAKVPKALQDQTLHPYYDDFTGDRWLTAELEQADPPALTFKVGSPAHWTSDQLNRANKHLATFKLAELYSSNAANELVNMQGSLSEIADAGGPDDVREELQSRYRSYARVHLNSWQSAMYECLAASHWFCNEGYALAI